MRYRIRLKDTDEYLLIHYHLGLLTNFEWDILGLKGKRQYEGIRKNLPYVFDLCQKRYQDEYLADNMGHFMMAPNKNIDIDDEVFEWQEIEEEDLIFGLLGNRK